MTNALWTAVEALTASQRAQIVRLVDAYAGRNDEFLRLLRGLRAEMWAADQRERAVLDAHEADRRAELDEAERRAYGELPPVEGIAWWPEGS